MAVNLSNVNISLDEFQKISSGWFNAGEVRLKDEHTLARVNHHVETWFFSNKEKIDHKEVLAIKQAFVNALSQNGIQGEALARIRQELGLAPLDAKDKSLVFRSVVPLTRQQIRLILDKNAAAINSFNIATKGSVYIPVLPQALRSGAEAKAAAKRDAVNAKLAAADRQVNVDQDIMRLQSDVERYSEAAPTRSPDLDAVIARASATADRAPLALVPVTASPDPLSPSTPIPGAALALRTTF